MSLDRTDFLRIFSANKGEESSWMLPPTKLQSTFNNSAHIFFARSQLFKKNNVLAVEMAQLIVDLHSCRTFFRLSNNHFLQWSPILSQISQISFTSSTYWNHSVCFIMHLGIFLCSGLAYARTFACVRLWCICTHVFARMVAPVVSVQEPLNLEL